MGLGTSFLYPERLDAHQEIDIPRSTLYCFDTIMDYLPLRGFLNFLERVGLMMERAIVWA